jgi:hypothetical protein
MRHLPSDRCDNGQTTSADRAEPRRVGGRLEHIGRRPGRVDRGLGHDGPAPRHADRGLAISKIAMLGALLVFAIAGLPPAALASSLLSGYGGPGEGSEAILGTTLVNGPSGGAGAGPSGGAGAAPAGTGAASVSGTAGSGQGSSGALGDERAGLSSSGSTRVRGTGGRAGPANGARSGAPATRAASPGAAFAAHAADRPAVESEHLGLTAQDLIFVLLVLAALAAVWALTVRLARTGSGGALSGAKGMAHRTRLRP